MCFERQNNHKRTARRESEQSGVFGGYWTTPGLAYSGGISNIGIVNDPANAK
jgi:hypothetical protein